MKNGKKLLAIAVFMVFLSALSMANGLNLNGLGSRAVAMGGAFVALANDFSAIYWNPAGIAQFDKKTFGFYGVDLIPKMTYKMDVMGMTLVDAETESKNYLAGMAAYYQPVGDNLVVGFGVYTPSGLGAKWDGADFAMISMFSTYQWESKVGVVTFSPAIAYKVSEQVMVGATLNVNYAMFDLFTHAGSAFEVIDLGQQEFSMTGWGYGATLGVLVKPSDMFSFGATFRTPTKIKLKGDTKISGLSMLGMIPGTPLFGAQIPNTSETETEVTWPMWLAAGIAVHPIENLTLTADVQYTNWKKIDVIEMNFSDPYWQLVIPTEEANLQLNWKDSVQIRFGGEYVINNLAFRAGYYYDPAPAPDDTMNVLLPSFDFNAVTVGLGYNLNGLEVGFCLEYLMGKDRDIPMPLTEEVAGMFGYYTMKVIVPNIAISYSW